jgi:hypothetical protein
MTRLLLTLLSVALALFVAIPVASTVKASFELAARGFAPLEQGK